MSRFGLRLDGEPSRLPAAPAGAPLGLVAEHVEQQVPRRRHLRFAALWRAVVAVVGGPLPLALRLAGRAPEGARGEDVVEEARALPNWRGRSRGGAADRSRAADRARAISAQSRDDLTLAST